MGSRIELPRKQEQTTVKEYEHLEPQAYPGRLVHVWDLGQHPNTFPGAKKPFKEEIMLVFEVSELMQDGKPFTVNWRGTKSLAQTAKLYELLTGWKPEIADMVKASEAGTTEEYFEPSQLLDDVCMINVTYTKSNSSDKMFNNIKNIMPLPRGMAVIDRQNPLIDFAISDVNMPIFESIWPWVQNIIKKSVEGEQYFGANAPKTPPLRPIEEDPPPFAK